MSCYGPSDQVASGLSEIVSQCSARLLDCLTHPPNQSFVPSVGESCLNRSSTRVNPRQDSTSPSRHLPSPRYRLHAMHLPHSNQITVVAFQPVHFAQASFLQKNQMLQNGFLIFVTQRWHKASVACKNQSF